MREKREYAVQGIPAFILVIVPATIGWIWIIRALVEAIA